MSKVIILLKHTKNIQLGHLYEHVYCTRIDRYFNEHSLYNFIDYNLIGRTYHGGIIYIEVKLCTKAALELGHAIRHLNITLNDTILHTHLTQLRAELEAPLYVDDMDKVVAGLEQLQLAPWQDIDEYRWLDIKTVRRRSAPLYVAEGKTHRSQKLFTYIVLRGELITSRRELLPLFRQLGGLINASLQDSLALEQGYYSDNDKFKIQKDKVTLTNTYKVFHGDPVDLKNDIQVMHTTIQDLMSHNVFERLLNELRNISYYERLDLAPDFGANYRNTLVAIGTSGWKELATTDNLQLLLAHTSILVRSGRKSLAINHITPLAAKSVRSIS